MIYLFLTAQFRREELKGNIFVNIVKQDIFAIWLGIILMLYPAQLIATKMYLDYIKDTGGNPPGGFFFYGIIGVPFFWFILSNLFSGIILFKRHKGETPKKLLGYFIKNLFRSIFFFAILFTAFISILNLFAKR